MKKLFFFFTTLTSLTFLLWSNNGLALGDPEAELTSPTQKTNSAEDSGLPWFTGPLLAGSGNTLPANHFNIQPYFFYTRAHGFFNSERSASSFEHNVYTYTPTLVMSVGLTDFMDVQAIVPYVYNHTNGQDNQNIGDSTFTLGFQLLRGETNTWRPSIRGTIGETFPIGEFENLDPNGNGTDSTGTGAYRTSLGLNFQQLWQVGSTRYFRDRLSLGYTFEATTHLQGFTAFGGNAQTRGKQKLGYQFSADLGFEYTLTDHWVPALDIMFTTNGSSNFTGVTGTNPQGLPAIENGHSGDELSLAPAIEYNVNSHLGIIAGPWFSIAGRNATQFTSVVVAVNYYQ
jgi:hypothetical protein